jgi:hypothetical protein
MCALAMSVTKGEDEFIEGFSGPNDEDQDKRLCGWSRGASREEGETRDERPLET